jgi:uncharacterized protein (TIGR03437 family)
MLLSGDSASGEFNLTRGLVTAVLCLFVGGWQQAAAQVPLEQSTQTVTFTGLGANANDDGTMQVAWGDCSYDGTNTNCTVSGAFTGLGPGGTYDYVFFYPGNGPSPLMAVTQAPGSDFVNFAYSKGGFKFTLNESNGTTLTYARSPGFSFVPGATSCTGNPSECGPGAVGAIPGATITGPITGSFELAPTIQTVISASNYGGFTSIAPATWIEIYGANLAEAKSDWTGGFTGNNAPTSVDGTSVTVGGQNAFVYYVSPQQVNVQVPSNVAIGKQSVIVTTAAGSSAPFSINVNTTEPGLLAPSPAFVINGTQYAVAVFSDGFYDLPPGTGGVAARLAVPGDTIMLYGIGFGPVSDGTQAGVIDQAANQLNASVHISIGGQTAQVTYAGLTPGSVGLYQFNVVIPNIPANDKTPLTFTLNGTGGTQTMFLFVGN